MHMAEVSAAAKFEYAPERQDVQALVPVTSALKSPAAHAVHTAEVVA